MPSSMPASTPVTGSISDVSWSFNSPPTVVTFRASTNVIGKLTVHILSEAPGSTVVTVTEGTSAAGPRNVSVSLPAGSAGKTFQWDIVLAPDDTTLRAYPTDGGFRVPGSRTVANGLAVNVRWNSFTWNRYTWAQYNPKNEAALP